jgi:ribosomal protein S6E (S10)
MVFKINIAEKSGKTYRVETENEDILGKALHENLDGSLISPDLAGYDFEIMGASDLAGFPSVEEVDGVGLKKILLDFNKKGMNKRPKHEGKRKRSDNRPKGLRLRKTVRGKVISPATVQINLKILKEGGKKLSEVFPDQNKAPEPEKPAENTEAPKAEASAA